MCGLGAEAPAGHTPEAGMDFLSTENPATLHHGVLAQGDNPCIFKASP